MHTIRTSTGKLGWSYYGTIGLPFYTIYLYYKTTILYRSILINRYSDKVLPEDILMSFDASLVVDNYPKNMWDWMIFQINKDKTLVIKFI